MSKVAALDGAIVSTGNLKTLAASPAWSRFGGLIGGINRIRGYGDFVHYHLLARAALDVVIESDVNILDIAALTVIVEEAGGKFTDLKGAAVNLATTIGARHQRRAASDPSWTPCASEARRCRCSCAGESSEYSAVAALMYAYNASKQHGGKARCPASRQPRSRPYSPRSPDQKRRQRRHRHPRQRPRARHLTAKPSSWWRSARSRRGAEGQPLDRLLRIQEIAFQEPVRRQRLEKVATFWFQHEGPAPIPEALRTGVISDCVHDSVRRHEALRAQARFDILESVEPAEMTGVERVAVDQRCIPVA